MARDDRAGGADGVFEGLSHRFGTCSPRLSGSELDGAAAAALVVAQASEVSMNGCHTWQLSLPLGLLRAYKPIHVCCGWLLVCYMPLGLGVCNLLKTAPLLHVTRS